MFVPCSFTDAYVCISVRYKARNEIAKSWGLYIYSAEVSTGKELSKVVQSIYTRTSSASPKLDVVFYILASLVSVSKYPMYGLTWCFSDDYWNQVPSLYIYGPVG